MGVKCPKCQHENPDDTLYCAKCAAPIKSAEGISVTKTLITPKESLKKGSIVAERYTSSRNWGNKLSKLTVDGREKTDGKDFRQGIRKGPAGEDLILWIRLESQKTVKITLDRSGK
jgi:hypothetical protein